MSSPSSAARDAEVTDMPTVLGIFVRQPVVGQVKTRLADQWSTEAATALYEAFLHDVTTRFRQTAERRVLCYSPDTPQARDWFGQLAGTNYELIAQSGDDGAREDLGRRLEAFFRMMMNDAVRRVVVLGSDSPTLPASYVEQAFAWLGDDWDAVLGPATDGGYYLIGLNCWRDGLWQDIDWSGPQVFGQQLQRLSEQNLHVCALKPWFDVDTLIDVERLKVQLAPHRGDASACGCPATLALLEQLGEM